MSKDIPQPESSVESELVQLLKDKGPKSPEARELFARWIIKEEAEADAGNTGTGRIILERKKAHLYLEAGFKTEALEALEAALMQASGEGEPELWDEVSAELDDVRSKE